MSDAQVITDAILGKRQQTAANAIAALGDNADEAARAIQLEGVSGTPASVIDLDLGGFESNQKAKLTSQILQNNDHIASYVDSHPLAAKVSNDDYGALDQASESMKKLDLNYFNPLNLSVSFGHRPDTPLAKAFKAFNEGYGDPWFGSWLYNPKDEWFYTNYPQTYRALGAVASTIGAPIEFGAKVFSGGLAAAKVAIQESATQLGMERSSAERMSRELIAMAEWSMMRGDINLHGGPMNMEKSIMEGQRAVKDARPYLDAGVEPPLGVTPAVDQVKAAQAKLDVENIKEATKDIQATNTHARSPELAKKFAEQHFGNARIGIDAEAVLKLYGDKPPTIEDGILGWVPDLARQLEVAKEVGGDIEVPLADWVTKIDPKIAKELYDHVRVRRKGVTIDESTALPAYEMVEAWHGSPHEFEAFSLDKIGTGEGAQTYGHGLYFAENKGVSETYKDAGQARWMLRTEKYGSGTPDELAKKIFTGDDTEIRYPLQWGLQQMVSNGLSIDQAIRDMGQNYSHFPSAKVNEAARLLREAAPKATGSGNLYRVRIHAEKEHFLDWDKPLSEQSPHVQEALSKYLAPLGRTLQGEVESGYATAGAWMEPYRYGEEGKRASALMREAGIPGIRYLDQGSRNPERMHKDLDFEKGVLAKLEKEAEGNTSTDYIGALKTLVEIGATDPRKTIAADLLAQHNGDVGAAIRDYVRMNQNVVSKAAIDKQIDAIEALNRDAVYNSEIPQMLEKTKANIARIEKEIAEYNPTYNYVLFDDKLIEIVDRNGEAINAERRAAGLEPLARRLWTNERILEAAEALEGRAEQFSPEVRAVIPEGELTEHEAKAFQAASDVIDRILPDVNLVGARLITNEGQGVQGVFQQYRDRVPAILYLLDPVKAEHTVRHEAIHFLRHGGFFSAREWATLREAAISEGWMAHYDIPVRYEGENLARMIEEAVAERYADWATGNKYGQVSGPVEKILGRIKDFAIKVVDAVKAALPGNVKVEDIFKRIESGEIGQRKGTKPLDERAYSAEQRPSAADMARQIEEQKIFAKANALGMTVKEYNAYMRNIAKRNMEDAAAAKERAEKYERRAQTKEWKEAERRIREEVTNDLNDRPDIAAATFFTEGRVQDAQTNRRPRIAIDSIDPELAKQLPKELLAKTGGIHADDVAGFFGFQSGNAMAERLAQLNALKGADKFSDFIKKTVDTEVAQRMAKEFGDLEANIISAAQDRVVSPTQMDLLHEEMMGMGVKAGVTEYPFTKAEIQSWVDQAFLGMRVGGISTSRFLRDSGKMDRRLQEALLAQKWTDAFKAAQSKYLSALLAREARKFEIQMEKFEATAKKFASREVSGVLPEYTNFIHDILMRIERPVKRSVQDLEKEISFSGYKDLESFVDSKVRVDGREMPVADFLFNPRYRKAVEEMNVEEFKAVHSSIQTMEKNGRNELKLEKAGEARDLAQTRAEMIEQLREFREKYYDPEGKRWMLGFIPPKFANTIRTYGFAHLQIESILNRWDKGDPRGLFTQYVMRPLVEGANYEAKLERDFSKKLLEIADKDNLKAKITNDLFMDYGSVLRGDPVPMIMTRKHLRAILMNAGNEAQLEKLARGHGILTEDGKGDTARVMQWIMQRATKADWDYAQKLGDIFAEIKVLADRMYRRMSGVAPDNVEFAPINTPHGTYKGWYYPIIYHPTWRGSSKKLMGGEAESGFGGEGFFRATTPNGYTQSRTGYAAPFDLSFDRMPVRLRQMIHDVAMREAIVNASKIFYDKDVLNAITQHYGKEASDLFVPYLKDVAGSANVRDSIGFADSHMMELLRQNIISVLIGYNPGTVMKHGATALVQSIKEVGAKEFAQAAASVLTRDPQTGLRNIEFAMKESEELQRRHTHYIETFKGATDASFGQGFSWRQANIRAGSWVVSRADLASAIPTWLAAYRVEMAKTGEHGSAVFFADRSVRRAHGSSAITNRPAIMRTGGGWMTALYNFFNHIMNRQYEMAWKSADATQQAKAGNFKDAAKTIPDLARDMAAYIIIPAIIEELVSPLSNDERESWGIMAAKALTKQLSASWVYGRDIAHALLSGHDPTAGLIGSGYNIGRDFVRDFKKDRPFDKGRRGAMLQHTITAFGTVTGLTTAQQGKWARFIYDYNTGQQRPRTKMDWYRAFRSGQSQKPRGH